MKSRKKKVRQIFSTSTFPIYMYISHKKIDINTNSTAYIQCTLFNVWSDVTHYTHVVQVLVFPYMFLDIVTIWNMDVQSE